MADANIREIREARRSIDGAKGRKTRKLANRDLQRAQHGKAFDGRRAADQEGRARPQD